MIAAPSGRGLVPILIILGGWALMDAYKSGALARVFIRPAALWAAIVSVLALASITWAGQPPHALKVGFSFLGLAPAGLSLLHSAEASGADERAATGRMLAWGLGAALALLAAGAAYGAITGVPLWGHKGQDALPKLSHAQTAIAVIAVPALATLWSEGGKPRRAALVLAAIMIGLYAFLEHGASNLAIAAAFVAYVAVRLLGQKVALLGSVLCALGVLTLPTVLDVFVPQAADILPDRSLDEPWTSSIHREYMWRFVLDEIDKAPLWLGHGADASRGYPGATQKIMWGIELMPLHPHNGALQVWLELGLLGALACALLPLLIGLKALRTSADGAALAMAVLSAYGVLWLLSYGIWQSWWLALAWLGAALARGLPPRPAD